MQDWTGQTVVILASGPSMTRSDADYCKGKARVITVNTTWKLAPWADVHYSSDHDWWALHLEEMRQQCSGAFWTGYPFGHIADDVSVCPYDKAMRGLSKIPGRIAWGGNSGYCAIGLAHQFGAKKIVLLGYDQKDNGQGHWHGHHPDSIRKGFNWPMWHKRFAELSADARRVGLEIINCSRDSALKCFPRKTLEEVIC